MYRSILVPLDGTAMAEHALLPAAEIARQARGRLALVVVHPMGAPEDAPVVGSRDDQELRTEEERYLAGLRARVATFGVAVEMDLIGGGDVVPALTAYARERGIDLVVASTHGRGTVTRLMLGGTALRLAHELRCPMLLVKPLAVGAHPFPAQGPRRVAIALDGSAGAESAIEAAQAMCPGPSLEYLLVRAIRLPLHATTLGVLRQESQRYLTQLAARLAGASSRIHVEWRVLLSSNPATAVETAATRWGADVLALVTRDRSEAGRTLLGSVTDHLVRTAPLPVLVCHTQPAAPLATLAGGA
jgi:nucleotide-binding universal stress UspA family protein